MELLQTPEEIFEQQNPQDGILPPWAKKVITSYSKQIIAYTLEQAAKKGRVGVRHEKSESLFPYPVIDEQSILSLKDTIIKELKLG